MNGDYTKVPLRGDERWTGARMQQGRVLVDHDWNLNLDATARGLQDTARDVIGPAGVVAGSSAFEVGVTGRPARDLVVQPGRLWVDGLAAFCPAPVRYSEQDQAPPLPASGQALVYLDVFAEHVHPAEAPDELLDPALAPVDTTARTRVGWRVRVAPTTERTVAAALAGLGLVGGSSGRLSITRVVAVAPADPCDPPGDPLGLLPDGLLHIEVIDGGDAATARFAWSLDGGASTVTAAITGGNRVRLAPSPAVKFARGDLVELSWLARRADRLAHGPLYLVDEVEPAAAGDELLLDRVVTAPATARGLAARRWDGQAVGATREIAASRRGGDLGLRFRAAAGSYLAGDWWGARLRSDSSEGVEVRTQAPPDGVPHAFAPLALVDLGVPSVIKDARSTFPRLVDVVPTNASTVTVLAGGDLQAAVDALPPGGGEVHIAAGEYLLTERVRIARRQRVVIAGVGPATVLRAQTDECALRFEDSSEVEVRRLLAVGATPSAAQQGVDGALTFVGCTQVRVVDCDLSCPDALGRTQACVTVRGGPGGPPDRVTLDGNRCAVGTWQTGMLVTDSAETSVSCNEIRFLSTTTGNQLTLHGRDFQAGVLARLLDSELIKPQPAVELGPLVAEFRAVEGPLTERFRTRRGALRAFLRPRLGPEGFAALGPGVRQSLVTLVKNVAVGGQGIVVGGGRAGLVRVRDNYVERVAQGIHVGTSVSTVGVTRDADTVLLAGNIVHVLVPPAYSRERHAVFVGNAVSASVLDTVATLNRSTNRYGVASADVEGIRVWGRQGRFLVVRHTSLRGPFRPGVRVTATPPAGESGARLWMVAETASSFVVPVVASTGVQVTNAVP